MCCCLPRKRNEIEKRNTRNGKRATHNNDSVSCWAIAPIPQSPNPRNEFQLIHKVVLIIMGVGEHQDVQVVNGKETIIMRMRSFEGHPWNSQLLFGDTGEETLVATN